MIDSAADHAWLFVSINVWIAIFDQIPINCDLVFSLVSQMQRMINQIGSQYDTPELRDKLCVFSTIRLIYFS